MIKQRRADFTDFNGTTLGILLLLVFFPIGIFFLILSSSMSGQAKAIISIVVLIVGFVPLLMLGVAFSQAGSSTSIPINMQTTNRTPEEYALIKAKRQANLIKLVSIPKCQNNILFLWNFLILRNCDLIEPPKDIQEYIERNEFYRCQRIDSETCKT
jgi:hypothetical protein